MGEVSAWPRYDPAQSYAWNYDHAPDPVAVDVPAVPGAWRYCGLAVDGPLGVPAGPLLNGRWCLYYASLGFDVLVYKTVRSQARACYEPPNLLPVDTDCVSAAGGELAASAVMRGSWAVSFGMPSQPPEVWRADVERTRRLLPVGKLLVVSVVGTAQPGWSLEELADDYARCARWALDSGAHGVEANFSCPNVCSRDGQLFQQPEAAVMVATRLREAVGSAPLAIKVGHVPRSGDAELLVAALAPHADALSMVNTISAYATDAGGQRLFAGQARGIAGRAIYRSAVDQVARFRVAIDRAGAGLELVGVGGAASTADVKGYLRAGAQSVHLATAAMLDPAVALRIRREWAV